MTDRSTRRWGAGIAAVAAAGVVLSCMPAAGDKEIDLDAVMTDGAQWIQANVDLDFLDRLDQVEIPPPEEWTRFWTELKAELNSGSIETLAALLPYAEAGARLLERMPEGEDYAAWLRQRLDYLEMANDAVRAVPETVPPRVPPARPSVVTGRTVHLLPPPAKVPPVTPSVAVRREAMAESAAAWKRKVLKRPVPAPAKSLVPRLKAVFREEGVPEQLVWIAEVESTMNPNARNPGGAAGLFQFMPATAKRFGLRTFLPDERKHPEKSARAAARYLRFLHGEFGSWPLAVAAYNAGEGQVRQSLSKVRKGETSFAAIRPHLPLETRMYVPKVEAVISLREGVDRLDLPPPRA